MATTMNSQLSPVGGSSISGLLDQPPPSPAVPSLMQGMGGGGAGIPASRQLPPDVLMGLMQTGNTMSQMFDSMASMVPDLAPDVAFAKDALQRVLSKLLLAGGGPTSTAAAGTPFPNGLPANPSPSA